MLSFWLVAGLGLRGGLVVVSWVSLLFFCSGVNTPIPRMRLAYRESTALASLELFGIFYYTKLGRKFPYFFKKTIE